MKKLGVAVVGPGWVAGEHIKAYLANPHVELRAIVLSRNSASQRKRAQEYVRKFRLKNVRVERDWHKALKAGDIDLVSVCSINCFHFEQACEALKNRKHLLLEKPMCFSEKELAILKQLYRAARVKASVSHVVRYYPALRKINEITRTGKLGSIYYIEADYWHEVVGAWKSAKKTGGSSLLMGGCHAVDMIFHMIGFDKKISQVMAYSTKARRRKDFEYDPTFAGIIKFKSGEIGKIGSSLESALPYTFHLQIMGTKGVVRNSRLWLIKNGKKQGPIVIPGTYADDGDVAHHPFDFLIHGLVDAVRKDREPPSSFEQGFKTYGTLFALEESMKTGKPVNVK
jgi:predicted dehydrogenase